MQESVLIDNRRGSHLLVTPVVPDVTMDDVNPNHEELIIIIDQA
jgi:hypothetical protein